MAGFALHLLEKALRLRLVVALSSGGLRSILTWIERFDCICQALDARYKGRVDF